MNEKNQRIIDYFAVIGLPPALTSTRFDDDSSATAEEQEAADSVRRELLFPTLDTDAQKAPLEPITDVAVVDQHLGERVPQGYTVLWRTPAGHTADLNAGSISPHPMFIAVRRSRDELPITDVGVYYEDSDKIKEDCYVVRRTVEGNSANVNNATLTGNRIFITYRRALEPVCNSFAVTDVQVIIRSKGELPPHSYNEVSKNLNTGLFGASVYICYKKSMILAPQIRYMPATLFRFPAQNHADIQYPHMVENFGLPMGANIECWPYRHSSHPHKAFFSSFIIMLKINDGPVLEKVYGTSITFHEDFDEAFLTSEQARQLGYVKRGAASASATSPAGGGARKPTSTAKSLHSNKCILLLSRHPYFESFRSFLLFIYNKYTKKLQLSFNKNEPVVPIERYISHLMYNVPFPTSRKPCVFIHLTEQDSLEIQLPAENRLPQSAASYIEVLENLGTENAITVFLFVLLQRSVMVHSLRPSLLTGIVEAIVSLIFPFSWRSNYLPVCPFNLRALIDSPVPIILGMDSRYFDLFETPGHVLCVDLDTNSISSTPERASINLKIMPRAPLAALKDRLDKITQEINELFRDRAKNNKLLYNKKDTEAKTKGKEAKIELSIREAFLRFMAAVLHDYKAFTRTVTKKPDLKAQDRNLPTFFDPEGFINSKDDACRTFYTELTRTQSFCDFIIDISFTPEHLADSLGFFADCCSKVDPRLSRDDRELIEKHPASDQTVVILPPGEPGDSETDASSAEPEASAFDYSNEPNTFPRLKSELHGPDADVDATAPKQPLEKKLSLVQQQQSQQQNTPIGVRTQADKQQAKRKIEEELAYKPSKDKSKNAENRFKSAKIRAHYLLSNAYALWFVYLSECLKLMDKEASKNGLNYAYQLIIQMHKHGLQQPDEICFRIMMQLCLVYKEPILAVKTLSYMRKHQINACQMTRSYYNTILTDPSNWPSSYDRWAKLRTVWSASCAFRKALKLRLQREEKRMDSMRKQSATRHHHHHGPQKSSARKQLQQQQRPVTYITQGSTPVPAALPVEPTTMLLPTVESSVVGKEASVVDDEAKSTKNSNNRSCSSISPSLSCSLSSINKEENGGVVQTAPAEPAGSEAKTGPSLDATPVAFTDPLGAFSSQAEAHEQQLRKESQEREMLETRRRLIDYQPFADEKKPPSSSDFIYSGGSAGLDKTPQFSLQHYKSDGEISKHAVVARGNASPASSSQNLVASNRNGDSASNESGQDESLAGKSDKLNGNKLGSRLMSVCKSIVYKSSSTGRRLFDKVNLDFDDDDEEDEDEYEDDDYDDEEEDEEGEEYDEEQQLGNGVDEEEEALDDEQDEEAELSNSSNEYDQDSRPRNYRLHKSDVSSVDNFKPHALAVNSTPHEPDSVSLSRLNSARREYSSPSLGNNASRAPPPPSQTMTTTPAKLFGLFRKKVESSGNKLMDIMSETLSKDTFITNVFANQKEITEKLKNMSNYQLSGLAKLNSFNSSVNVYDETTSWTRSNANNIPNSSSNMSNMLKVNNKQLSTPKTASQTSLDTTTAASNDLDDLPVNEDSYQKLTFDWWGVDLNPLNAADKVLNTCASIRFSATNREEFFGALVEVEMTSCNYCENCKSFLYDEDIMSGWTLNDSDLNIRCIHCLASFVPKLFIKIVDHEELLSYAYASETAESSSADTSKNSETANEAESEASSPQKTPEPGTAGNKAPRKARVHHEELTAPYLSPIVVRKEIENILINRQHTHEDVSCVFDQKLMEEHPEIYWNLLWLFRRIGVDNGQLAANLLNVRLRKILESNTDNESTWPKFVFQFKKILPNKNGKPYDLHPNLKMKCAWDNLRYHSIDESHELPLYINYLKMYEAAISKKLESRLVTIQSLKELSQMRRSSFNPRTLNELFVAIIKNIKESDTTVPIRSLLALRSKMKNTSIYREILFLVMIALDREKVDLDAFDNEYRKSYRLMVNSESQSTLKQYDRPPNNLSVWCRRLFSPLLL